MSNDICQKKCISVYRLYNNHITDVGAKLVAQIIEECPKLAIVKYAPELYNEKYNLQIWRYFQFHHHQYHHFIFRIGKNKITSVGGRYLASAIQKSTSIFDVG